MDYTDAILRRLRDRLLRYRSDTRHSGRKQPWHRVAMDILDADSISKAFYQQESDSHVLGEALRRFAAGLQTPTVERLDAITAFLTEKDYLAADDLEEADRPLRAFQEIARLIGPRDQEENAAAMALAGAFLAETQLSTKRYDYAVLRLTAAGALGLQVEETRHATLMPARTRDPAALKRFFKATAVSGLKRDGWICRTSGGQYLILMRDRLEGDTEVTTLVFNEGESDGNQPVRKLIMFTPVTNLSFRMLFRQLDKDEAPSPQAEEADDAGSALLPSLTQPYLRLEDG